MSFITSAGSGPLLVGGGLLTNTLRRSTFDGVDGSLPAGFIDGHDFDDTYCPVGIKSNGFAATDPYDNVNVPVGGSPPFDGIGCCWTDLDSVDVEAQVTVLPLSNNWRECTPLLHVVPGTPLHGMGAWLSTFASLPNGFLLVGYIANPCTDFSITAVAAFTRSASNQTFVLRSVGGAVSCYLNGTIIPLTRLSDNATVSSMPVDASLAASTLHGFAVDAHLEAVGVERPGATGNLAAPVISDSWLTGL